jgi:hypothetical protein
VGVKGQSDLKTFDSLPMAISCFEKKFSDKVGFLVVWRSVI